MCKFIKLENSVILVISGIKDINYNIFHVIMEAKSHDRLYTVWRSSEAAIVACRPEGQEVDGMDSSHNLKT